MDGSHAPKHVAA